MKLLLLVFFSLLTGFEVTFGDENGAATKPYVTSLKQTENWALLQCEVRGAFPKPKLHWQDSDGNILHAEEPKETEAGGRYDIILNITVTKTDNYRCVATQEEIKHQIYSETSVFISGAAPKPYVMIVNQTVNSALLQCEVRGALPKPKLHWQDSDGNILHAEEPKVTERGGRYDVILQINVTKTDNYRCVATQEEIKHQIYAETYVFISGAATKPYVMIVDQTADWALLQCEVRGAFPKPKLHWQDRAGNIFHAEEPKEAERGGRYDVILNITVTKTDRYRCVATQEEINHQIYAEIYAFVFVSGLPTRWIVAAVLGAVFFLVLGIIVLAVLKRKGYIKLHRKKGRRAADQRNQHEPVPLGPR